MLRHVLYFTLITSLIGCGFVNSVEKNELVKFINNPDNNLSKVDSINELKYNVIFKPSDLIAYQYLKGSKAKLNIDSLKQSHQKYIYFNLNISLDNKELFSQKIQNTDFDELQKIVSFKLDKYISLRNDNNEELKLIDFNYPRLYGMTSSTNILLVFLKNETENTGVYKMVINDFIKNEGHQLEFIFKKKDILNTPNLNFNYEKEETII